MSEPGDPPRLRLVSSAGDDDAAGPGGGPGEAGLRVLAVDDEPPALGELVYLLERTAGVAEVTPAGGAAEALAVLQGGDVDAVFLDIRMPGIDGLALAGILARFAEPPPVVFVTAYDTHAVEAFDVAAVDYLLKPIRAERLAQAVARVQRARATAAGVAGSGGSRPAGTGPGRAGGSAAGSGAADATAGPGAAGAVGGHPGAPSAPSASSGQEAAGPPPDETIAVELGGVTRYVRRSDVVYVEAQRDYVRLCTRTGGHLVRIPLAALEERWAPVGFLRVHRRYLVNSAYVEGLRSSAGIVSVDLGQDQTVPVSRRFASGVRAALVQRHRLDRDGARPRRSDRSEPVAGGPGAQVARDASPPDSRSGPREDGPPLPDRRTPPPSR